MTIASCRSALPGAVAAASAMAVLGASTLTADFGIARHTESASARRGAMAEEAADQLRLDVVKQLGGYVFDVAVDGDVAFVGVGPRLVAFDVSSEGAPRAIEQSPPFDGVVTDVAAENGLVVAATAVQAGSPLNAPSVLGGAAVNVLRYDDGQLRVIGRAAIDGVPKAVWTDGRLVAAVAQGDVYQVDPDWSTAAGDLWTYEVSDQGVLPVGHTRMAVPVAMAGSASQLVLLNRTLDESVSPRQWWLELRAMNISNPRAPVTTSARRRYAEIDGAVGDMAVGRNHAFVVTLSPPRIQAISLADPLHMQVVGNLEIAATDAAVVDDLLYAASPMSSSAVVDVTDPAMMRVVSSFPTANALAGGSRRLVSFRSPFTLASYARVNPTTIDLLGTWSPVTHVSSIASVGSWVFAAQGDLAMATIADGGDADPVVVEWSPSRGGWSDVATRMAAAGDAIAVLSVGGSDGSLRIGTIGDPPRPQLTTRIALDGSPVDLDMAEGLLVAVTEPLCWVAGEGGSNELVVVDVNAAGGPSTVSTTTLAGAPGGVAVAGDRVFVVSDSGLETFRVQPAGLTRIAYDPDPRTRSGLDACDFPVNLQAVTAAAERLLVVTDSDVRVYDISAPLTMTEIRRFSVTRARQVALIGDATLVVGTERRDQSSEILAFDLTSASQAPISRMVSPSGIAAILGRADSAIVATNSAGILWLRLRAPSVASLHLPWLISP